MVLIPLHLDTATGRTRAVPGAPASGSVQAVEPVVVAGGNPDVIHLAGTYPVPLFVTTSDGDIVTAGAI